MLLFYVLAGLLGLVIVGLNDLLALWPLVSAHPYVVVSTPVVAAMVLTFVAGHATHNEALRSVSGDLYNGREPDPPTDLPRSACWYIESRPGDAPPHSCSFVEFDERGDYLDFRQHRHAYERIEALARPDPPLTLVIFVHGWRNNGQSGNVVAFNEFLHQMSTAYRASGQPRRVHGVYLAWRGGCLRPTLTEDATFRDVTARYGGPVVDTSRAAQINSFNGLLESLSYFDRKSVPEHKFSGTAFSRTIFTMAYAAKRTNQASEVFLIGHSFGGLMLERTFQNAAISQLTEAWRWGHPEDVRSVNPLPFDTVVMVNSAAPSIYAKQFQSYLAAHRQAMIRAGVAGANAPIFFSLTSAGDWATGKIHPTANRFAGLLPTLRRQYRGDDFVLEEKAGNRAVTIPQAYYYRHTPGHNPLLVNRFIEAVGTPRTESASEAGYVEANLTRAGADPLEFSTSARPGAPAHQWTIRFPPETEGFNLFSTYDGRRPVVWTQRQNHYVYRDTAYWILRCPKDIIKDHNDIWSQPAMETYAALHRIALEMRRGSTGR